MFSPQRTLGADARYWLGGDGSHGGGGGGGNADEAQKATAAQALSDAELADALRREL